MNNKGSSVTNKNLVANDYTYTAGQNIQSDIDTKIFNTGYRYNLFGLEVGVDYYNFSSKILLNNNANKTDISLDYNIYALGVDGEHTFFDNFLLTYGLGYGIGERIRMLDYYVSAGIKDILLEDSSITLGYKAKEFDFSDDFYSGKSKYDGPSRNVQYQKGF